MLIVTPWKLNKLMQETTVNYHQIILVNWLTRNGKNLGNTLNIQIDW